MTTRIGTRASALALWQARHVVRQLSAVAPHLSLELVTLSSHGDDRLDAPLDGMDSVGVFTSTLEAALLAGKIDVAVHSLKDLPTTHTRGLMVAAIPARGPVEDVLCSRAGLTLEQLPLCARVGSSSPRRVAQLHSHRPDLEIVPVRGNVPTRLVHLDHGKVDAVVLARAGLERLGLRERITQVFSPEEMLPAPGQGALAIQVRAGDVRCRHDVAPLDHPPTRRAVEAERTLLRAMEGGCSMPLGAFAREEKGRLVLDGGVFDSVGHAVRVRMSGTDPEALGASAATWLLSRGADRLLVARHPVQPVVFEERP